ncbi:peptidoglycan editing factor PgeF [Leptospirillum ferrooxidans]|uniref:Purine nucleoside phosphorylase n=1 Tax=Leptospirillum ferrooxidans (strain C2-3) TaxID=1162668 RepID=I0IQB0_LEPFC|nr:peptidoglycan editing factor PgeF [Leptospirillum ferrooxidans]BAM07459.1 hypothetical protein LFE_1780 [Leptospirillum ferrooxidans C2-3]
MYLRHPLLSSYGIEHGFGLALSKDPASRPLTARQVHGVDVRRVDENRDAAFEADGLWTEAPGTRIGIWTADCLPVLFADKGGRVVSAVHAGWRGAVRGIVTEALERLKKEGNVPPSNLLVVLGPSAGRCCYEVGPEVHSEALSRYPDFLGRKAHPNHFDLPGLVLHQLASAGVPSSQTGSIDLCTICHPELFFSHRRQGSLRSGRSMINWIQSAT